MSSCRECADLLFDYVEGSLDVDTARELESHFEACPPCVSFLNTYRATGSLCKDALYSSSDSTLGVWTSMSTSPDGPLR